MNSHKLSKKIAKLMIEKLDKNQLEEELYHLLILLPKKELETELVSMEKLTTNNK